jgi:G6PDH family F420-dependent oxidoreductase
MVELGYAISSEEVTPLDAVKNAQRAEEVGFTFALISDHYHPWTHRQGHSPFVWGVIGGIAQATDELHLGTGVTCPTVRIHPAVIAQAAATAELMMPGRFFLGVGTGERLNEHILGHKWPPFDVRSEMLAEAVYIIRMLWEADTHTYYGTYYTVEEARVYSLPDRLPPIYVAAGGQRAAELAGEIGDGLITTAPKAELIEAFEAGAPGEERPTYGQVAVCWAETQDEAERTAYEWWPNAALHGELAQELRTPEHFVQATKNVTREDVAQVITCGPDPERHLKAIREYVDAGYDHVYVHQIGPDQEGFFDFYRREILPEFK